MGAVLVVVFHFLCENSAGFLGGNLNAQTLSNRFSLPARPDPVRFCSNEEVGEKKRASRSCSRQSLSAEDLGWLVHPRSTNVAHYYATSEPHTFFDITPLKYNSWDEYEKGVKAVLAGYKSAKFTLNDDVAIHPHGDLVWATATVAEQMITKAGKVEMGKFRWTVVMENVDGKWLTVHEHVSAPLQ